jgi:hypothetical protein
MFVDFFVGHVFETREAFHTDTLRLCVCQIGEVVLVRGTIDAYGCSAVSAVMLPFLHAKLPSSDLTRLCVNRVP